MILLQKINWIISMYTYITDTFITKDGQTNTFNLSK